MVPSADGSANELRRLLTASRQRVDQVSSWSRTPARRRSLLSCGAALIARTPHANSTHACMHACMHGPQMPWRLHGTAIRGGVRLPHTPGPRAHASFAPALPARSQPEPSTSVTFPRRLAPYKRPRGRALAVPWTRARATVSFCARHFEYKALNNTDFLHSFLIISISLICLICKLVLDMQLLIIVFRILSCFICETRVRAQFSGASQVLRVPPGSDVTGGRGVGALDVSADKRLLALGCSRLMSGQDFAA